MSSPTTLTLDGSGRARTPRIGRSEQIVAVAVVLLLFLEHLAFGGGRREIALGFAAVQGLALAVLILVAPWARQALARPIGLRVPAIAFGVVVLVALWSLTPWVPGGPHPVWTYVQAPAAAAIDKSAVLIQLIQLSALACVFLLGWILGADDDRARYLFGVLVLAAGGFAVWAFLQHLVDPAVLFGVVPMPASEVRLTAAFLSANTAGTWFGVAVLLTACALVDRLRDRSGPGSLGRALQRGAGVLVALAFCSACLILTASRGALAATALALVVFFGWEAAARRWRLIGPAGLGMLGLVLGLAALLMIGGTPFFERLLHVGQDVAGRRQISEAHWHAFLASPWMGYGLGSFDAIDKLITTGPNYAVLWIIHAAHNVYLQWLEEAGLLGAVPMFFCIAWLVAVMARGSVRRTRLTTWLRGLVAASLVILIHGATDYALQVPSMATFWAFLLGVGAAVATRQAVRS